MTLPPAAEKSSTEQRGTLPAAPGSRPEGARDEREAGARVREMFGHIAPRYDFLNHLLSLSFDRLWRRRTARRFSEILARSDSRVLDLCCGTGDLAFALSRRAAELRRESASRGLIVGSDFAIPMVELAAGKGRAAEGTAAFWPATLCRCRLPTDPSIWLPLDLDFAILRITSEGSARLRVF